MIVNIKDVLKEKEFKNIDEDKIKRKLRAVEKGIRSYTNNKFLDTKFRFYGQIKDNKIYVPSIFFKINDNVEISHSLNDDVFTVIEVSKDFIVVNEPIYDANNAMITKIVYPEDVKEGVINILKWDFGLRNKVRNKN